MRRLILFNLEHPKMMLAILLVITLISSLGLTRIEFDSSTEVLMPRHDPIYKLGERAKMVFGDSRTFMITSIEPASGHSLFSSEVFTHVHKMVKELEEYKDFDQTEEDSRLKKLLELANITVVKSESANEAHVDLQNDKTSTGSTDLDDIESELDKQFLQGSGEQDSNNSTGNNTEMNELEAQLDDEFLKDDLDESANTSSSTKKNNELAELEAELDEQFLNDGSQTENQNESSSKEKKSIEELLQNNEANDIWNMQKELPQDRYRAAIRERNQYNYDNYEPVTLTQLRAAFSEAANAQLDTIIAAKELELSEAQPLTNGEFKTILEAWEDIYLFKSKEIIKNLLDPITGEDILGTDTELKPVDLIPENEMGERILPSTTEEFELFKAKLKNNPSYRSSLYAANESGEIIALGLSITLRAQKKHDKFVKYFFPLVNKYNTEPVSMYVMGTSLFNMFMNDFSQKDLRKFLPLVILVVIITFYLNFRLFSGLLLPTLTVVLSTVWAIGLMGALGIKMTIIGSILPPLLIAVGSSYSIHIFNQYLLDRKLIIKEGRKPGLLDAMSHISTTVFLAGFTTFISFLTLTVNQVTALRDFGIFAALGTVFAVIVSIIMIPSALMLMKQLPAQKQHKTEDDSEQEHGNALVRAIIAFFSHFAVNHSKFVVMMVILTMGLGIWGMTYVTTETAPTTFFKEDSYVRKATFHIGDVFDGSMVLNVVFDSGESGGAYDPEFLKFIEDIRNWVEQPEQKKKYNMLRTTTFSDFIKRMHQAMNSEKKEFYAIPDKKTTVRDYLEIFSGDDEDSDGRIDAFESTVDTDYRRVNLMIRLGATRYRDFGTAVSRQAREAIDSFINQHDNPQGYSWVIVGEPVNFVVLGDYIVRGQVISIILSIFIVGLVVFLLFRNVSAGLMALIPISATIIMVFGLMGFLGIPLDMAKAILSSIAIGIGVDDTIHFLNTLRKKLKEGLPLKDAIEVTHNESGLAIVYTSIALVFGFAVLLFSSFTPIFHFGFLVSSVMIATTMAALMMLPAVINLLQLNIHKQSKSKIFDYLNLSKFLEE